MTLMGIEQVLECCLKQISDYRKRSGKNDEFRRVYFGHAHRANA
jgi:hypothetical protein